MIHPKDTLRQCGTILLFLSVPGFLFLLTACMTPPSPYHTEHNGDRGTLQPGTTYFLLKGNGESMINNRTFSTLAPFIEECLTQSGAVPAEYGDADIFISVTYGTDSYPSGETILEPRYDRKKGVTRWVHPSGEMVEMAYLSLRALDGTGYREEETRRELWSLSIRNGETDGFYSALPSLCEILWTEMKNR